MSNKDGFVNKSQFRLSRTTSARSGHVAVCYEKYLIVWGGYYDGAVAPAYDWYLPPQEIWIYDTELKLWYWYETGRGHPIGTSGATACLQDHSLYIFGGHGQIGNSNNLFKLDLKTMEWECVCIGEGGEFPSPRDKCSSWIHENKFYCFGGFGIPVKEFLCDHGVFIEDASTYPTRGWNNQLVIFDIKTKKWSNPQCIGEVPLPRAAHATAKIDDKVYMFGGRHMDVRLNDLHCLDLNTLTWSGCLHTTGNQPEGRSWHSFTAISDNQIFLYGGFSCKCVPLGDAWLLDVKSMQWTALEHFPHNQPRLWHAAASLYSQDVVIFGGCSNNILDHESEVEHCNEVLMFQLQPHSLVRVCVEAVYKLRQQTECDWDGLPLHLKNRLKWRAREEDTLAVSNSVENSKKLETHENSNIKTCCVS